MKRLFYGVFFLFMAGILTVVLKRPQNNLIPGKQFLYMLIWIVLLLGIRGGLSLVERVLDRRGLDVERISRAALVVCIGVYGAALYLVSLSLRAWPITDYENMYNAASALASGQAVEEWNYFARWTNNLGGLGILALCMKLGRLVGFTDPYYFVLALNVLQAMLVMGSVYYLAGQIRRNHLAMQWMAVIVYAMWTPVWGYTSAFYSDQLSFGSSILATALLFLGCRRQKKRGWICIILAGILWGVGGFAKVTAMIPLIALAAAVLLCREKRRFLREYFVFAAVLILTVGCLTAVFRQFPSRELEEQFKTPSEYWIALGLLGKGTYGDNIEFVNDCIYQENYADRVTFCRTVIKENWKNLFDAERMAEKTSVIFGAGDISPTSLQYPYEENFLWNWFYWEGKYFWKYACLSTAFFYAVLFLMIVGALAQFVRQEERVVTLQSYAAVFGLFFFLLLWEAQNKQLYNHIPWMTLACIYGLERMRECVILVEKRILERRHSYAGAGTEPTE